MLLYTDQVRRIIIAVVVIVAVSAVVYVLILPRETPSEASVSGVVVSPNGMLVGGATVYVLYNPDEDPREEFPVPDHTQTTADGGFTLSGLQFRRYYLVAIHPDHCDSEGTEVVVTSRGVNGVRLHMLEGGQVTGSIDSSQGSVANREVHLYSHRGSRGWRKTKTDSSGRIHFDRVIAQDYTIEVKPPGYGTFESTGGVSGPRRQITVRVGQATNVVFGKD